MICTACGKVSIDGALFCEQCGASLQAQPAINPGPAAPGPAAPGPAPATFTPPAAPQIAPVASALIASMSMGEKISGGGAVAAVIGFFLPWITVANQGSASGLNLAKSVGAVYLILLIALAAAALCYFSSKAAPAQKLMYAGYLVLLGALSGPANLLALLFVSQVQTVAGFGLWLFSLGYTAIAAGGLMTIREFSKRTY